MIRMKTCMLVVALAFIFYVSHAMQPISTACDDIRLQSKLILDYNVSTVFTVGLKGCTNFASIQKAIDAVPDFSAGVTLIIVDVGVYREKVRVNSTKTNLVIQGQGYMNTSIEWNDYGNLTGTYDSYSFGVFAVKFAAYNISFKTTAPPANQGEVGAQAVALRVNGDQAAFFGCGIYGAQDTLHDDQGRHYFKDCFIEGSIDFIFGNGRSLYEGCIINSIAKPEWVGDGGYITAQGQESLADQSGFSFVNCHIDGSGHVLLGRPYRPLAKVIISTTFISNVVSAIGWNDKINNISVNMSIFFAEYNNMGPGAIKTSPPRASYGKQLSDSEAAPYINISYINGMDWLRHISY